MGSRRYATHDQLLELFDNLMLNLDAADAVRVGARVPFIARTPRWLRFDPNNHRNLIIKEGTVVLKRNGLYQVFDTDTSFPLAPDLGDAGKDYYVNLSDAGTLSASTTKLNTGVTIGRFHTLCADVGNITMISPASPSSGITVGDNYLIKPYHNDTDPDFYAFYNKEVTAVSAGTPYDVITTTHPLSGYVAGDILPESVICLGWEPKALFDDAMVYDVVNDIFVDVYLQSGTGINTRSKFNETHTVNRQQPNYIRDMNTVGKRLLCDSEFFSIALGSNECTAIQGEADKTTVGGHVDTNSRRMISAIGCEECCGYLWQWLNDISTVGGSNWNGYDGRNSFGQTYGTIPYGLLAGSSWIDSSYCGSGSRNGYDSRLGADVRVGCRGCCSLK